MLYGNMLSYMSCFTFVHFAVSHHSSNRWSGLGMGWCRWIYSVTMSNWTSGLEPHHSIALRYSWGRFLATSTKLNCYINEQMLYSCVGYFIIYWKLSQTEQFIKTLNNYKTLKGCYLGIRIRVNNCCLLVGIVFRMMKSLMYSQ